MVWARTLHELPRTMLYGGMIYQAIVGRMLICENGGIRPGVNQNKILEACPAGIAHHFGNDLPGCPVFCSGHMIVLPIPPVPA